MKMTFGLCLFCTEPPDRLLAQVRLAEDLGFRYVWLADTAPHARDVFVYLTMIALNTTRIGFGPCILHPYVRHLALGVSGMVTLDELSGGRALLGIGIGGGVVSELGFKPATLAVMREALSVSRRLMRGEKVDSSVPPVQMKGAQLRFTPKQPLPIYLAATGPKMLELCGEQADGVFVHVGVAPAALEFAQSACRAGTSRRSAGLMEFDFSPFVYTSVAPDRATAFADCRRGAGVVVKRFPHYAELAGCGPEELAALRQGGSDAEKVLTDRVVDQFSLSGTVEDCRAKLARMWELGITHVTMVPAAKDNTALIATIGRDVLPHFAA
jgi:5,10-methylenetetrahydromethanopterin reductase